MAVTAQSVISLVRIGVAVVALYLHVVLLLRPRKPRIVRVLVASLIIVVMSLVLYVFSIFAFEWRLLISWVLLCSISAAYQITSICAMVLDGVVVHVQSFGDNSLLGMALWPRELIFRYSFGIFVCIDVGIHGYVLATDDPTLMATGKIFLAVYILLATQFMSLCLWSLHRIVSSATHEHEDTFDEAGKTRMPSVFSRHHLELLRIRKKIRCLIIIGALCGLWLPSLAIFNAVDDLRHNRRASHEVSSADSRYQIRTEILLYVPLLFVLGTIVYTWTKIDRVFPCCERSGCPPVLSRLWGSATSDRSGSVAHVKSYKPRAHEDAKRPSDGPGIASAHRIPTDSEKRTHSLEDTPCAAESLPLSGIEHHV